jgi:hypothetical protein
MEKSEIVVKEAIEQLGSIENHSSLVEHLMSFEDENIESLLNIECNNKLIKTDNEIRQIVSKAKNSATISGIDQNSELTKIVHTSNVYLVKSIKEADLKSLILFLNVNCYLLADIKCFLQFNGLTNKDTEGIAEKIVELLSKVSFEVKAQSGAPYHEIEMMKEYEDGVKNSNIKSTYSLIEAIERSGRGFHFNFLLENIVKALYILNFQFFLKAIGKLSKPQSFIFFLQSLTREHLYPISEEKSLTNKWLNFELIRQTTKHETEGDLNSENLQVVKKCLLKLMPHSAFFKQSIKYFRKSRIFNKALAEVLALNSNELLEEIVNDCFEINKNIFLHEARNDFMISFKNSVPEDRHLRMLELIFCKWDDFFNKLRHSDEYQNELLLTDYCDFIVEYYYMTLDENDIINEMNYCLNDLKYIDSIWSVSQTHQTTIFNLILTRLYLLTFTFRGREIINEQIIENFSDFESNSIMNKRFIEGKGDGLIKIMKENIESTNR